MKGTEEPEDQPGDAGLLLEWYDLHRRDLPWRRSRDPYRIWLSEIMLQQTRVEAAIPYYERFLERFPTVEDLAGADLEEVLSLWSGLGYYRRARQLHAAAERIAAEGFPRTAEGLRQLPGIGAYTSAAVASIAFGEVVPVMDGNVERVTSRLLAEAGEPKRAAVRRRLTAEAGRLLDRERPGDSNQALMELGATVCLPRRPRCLLCPLSEGCEARRQGDPEAYPTPKKRRAPVRLEWHVALVEEPAEGPRGPRALMFRRGEDEELMAGLWELPWVEVDPEGGAKGGEAAGGRQLQSYLEGELGGRYGGRWRLEGSDPVAEARHGITHRSLTLKVWRARMAAEGGVLAEGPEAGWFDAEARQGLPLSSLVGKVFEGLS